MSVFFELKQMQQQIPHVNNRQFFARIFFDAILLLTVLFAPWWLFGILALSGMMYWEKFYEGIIAALIFDALFGLPIQLTQNLSFQYFFFTIMLALYFLVAFVKTKIR